MHQSTDSSLSEWLQYIEAIHPTEIDLGLARLQTVAKRLLPETIKPFIYSVAGTNGKGTTTAALSALSSAAGLSVGWYSSPHIQTFNERIQINGQPIADAELVAALERVDEARGEISLSYFEFTTLAAFVAFADLNLDVWILEVGLGGRLDAVNILDADVAVITSIGLDHQDFLGDDIDGIGREKAGIARPNRPLILGQGADNSGVLRVAEDLNAIVYRFGDRHGNRPESLYWQEDEIPSVDLPIPTSNAACALQAFAFGPGTLSREEIIKALACLNMPGRLQTMKLAEMEVILDVGHNPQAADYIAKQLQGRQYHLIIGMLDNKDAAGFMQRLQPISKSIHLVTLNVARGRTAESLAEDCHGHDANCYASVEQAIAAVRRYHTGEPIFVGGSFYTVQAAFDYLGYSVGA